jgi:putative flippase GtrA
LQHPVIWIRHNTWHVLCFVAVGGVLMGLSVLVGHGLVHGLGLPRTTVFLPQYTITVIFGYVLHANSTCRDQQLCLRTNGRRWVKMRAVQLAAGFVISAFFLHILGVPYQPANQASGLLVGIPTYWFLRNWALAEKKEVKA